MQDKDIAEKNLFGINKLFANIANFAIFKGENVLKETDLQDDTNNQTIKENKHFKEYRRDLIKIVITEQTKLAIFAIENQSVIDQSMLFRVMHYDSLSYLKQLKNGIKPGKILPVKTIVLYFGVKPWNAITNMNEMLSIPKKMKGLIPNYFIKVVDLGSITIRQKTKLHPDLQVLVEVIQALRQHKKLVASTIPFEFPEETLDVISLVTGDNSIKIKYNELVAQGKEQVAMCEIYKQWIDEGIQKGFRAGRKEGIRQGRTEGKAQGIAEGKAEGKLEAMLETARNALKMSLSIEQIIQLTGLSRQQIQELALSV